MSITKYQISAAMALLGINQAELSNGTGISKPTISNYLKPNSGWETKESTKQKIVSFLRSRGIEFTDGNGVRERSSLLTYSGQEGFRRFMDDVYEVAQEIGEEICLFNARPANWIKWLGEEWYNSHSERMQEVRKENHFDFRVTAERGDYSFIGGKFAEYRWVPDRLFNQESVYVYGNRLALMDFNEANVKIFVLYKQEFADSFRAMFNHIWETATEIPDSDNHKPKG